MGGKPFSDKMGNFFRGIVACCCSEDDEEEAKPTLQISGPTDFRREDISFPGLDPEALLQLHPIDGPPSQQWIREQARADAHRMYETLQPLRSSPSGQFATPPSSARATLPSYEQFVTPRTAPTQPARTVSGNRGSHALDRVRAHARKISNSLNKPLGYQSVGGSALTGGRNPYEMRALMDAGSRSQVDVGLGGSGKMSGESFSFRGSNEGRKVGLAV
ncbi:hypothetical protein BAUCODRAFT_27969 [Baudoinia panamericana UAMH 10762]|uniref:Uncharacterized protein n=1 Tax=Baudoinia panamericana (strain UAMH 10762) TaxID=717646 RepID=M2MZE0_BAUPA|nr:uncharacterized protein BAUCODRAFT_27969 [Baudoinia panamericana UAMH 10762]EMC91700.1 hypothetical protein BAUCODRAFT_27969 [Baudoinia panamericana UAMH 10762]